MCAIIRILARIMGSRSHDGGGFFCGVRTMYEVIFATDYPPHEHVWRFKARERAEEFFDGFETDGEAGILSLEHNGSVIDERIVFP